MISKKVFLFIISLILISNYFGQSINDSFIRGADISSISQIEDLGGVYKENGAEKDVLSILQSHGINYIRLRIWHTPSNGYCSLLHTVKLAERIKKHNLKFLLDIHYSDTWADPANQTKPAVWSDLTYDILKDSVYRYTKNIIEQMKKNNSLPDIVQIGNEITNGMLWPDGKLYDIGNSDEQWNKFSELIKSGIRGVKDASDSNKIKIMIHIDKGGDNSAANYFYDHLVLQGLDFDIIGLSYYPWWQGSLENLKNNLNNLATRYQKEIVVVETAYPWTYQYKNDNNGNIVGPTTTLLKEFPATIKGQKDYIISLSKMIKETKNGLGTGFIYWEPAYISVPPIGSMWENLTTFDFNGESLESLNAFQNLDSLKPINIILRINTSTLADTLRPNDYVQIRGEVLGTNPNILPDGNKISWDENSTLICKNVGGDYWECRFQAYPFDHIIYKIWTGRNSKTPTSLNLGWEGAIIPFDSSNINSRLFIPLIDDSINCVEYYHSSNKQCYQFWTPFKKSKDSVGVLFRVNISNLKKAGLFDPNKNSVSIKGDSITTKGVLSWVYGKPLKKEEINDDFYSGVIYFPQNKIPVGTKIKYNFFIENSTFEGGEKIGNREFCFTKTDTTLFWQYFNNKNIITSVNKDTGYRIKDYQLFQNYPNPFNPSTTISYHIPIKSKVTLKLYNLVGQEIETLIDEYQEAGYHSTLYTLNTSLASGIYFYRMKANGSCKSQKMLLLK